MILLLCINIFILFLLGYFIHRESNDVTVLLKMDVSARWVVKERQRRNKILLYMALIAIFTITLLLLTIKLELNYGERSSLY